jgi:hypothetical protein
VEIFHDAYLPTGSTAMDYLRAQRRAQEEVVTKTRHLDAEPGRRDGRPTYRVRDEWDLDLGASRASVAQDSLLLVDAANEALHGYAVVVTLMRDDRPALEPVVRAILDSVGFAKP